MQTPTFTIIKEWLARYGAFVVVAAAVPGIVYLSMQAGPADRFRPLFVAERPGDAALRADDGPPGPEAQAGVTHVALPAFVKGIYVSAATAGDTKRFGQLGDLVDRTELNAMVIDVKEGDGAIAFVPVDAALAPYAAAKPELGKLADFTKPLHDKGIYLIARVFVFQDPWLVGKRPELAVKRRGGGLWRDRRGTTWLDPASREVWKYNAAIAREAYAGGFDEVQFDYIRFLSDGNMAEAAYPAYDGKTSKADVIRSFFGFMDAELREKSGIPISADLFGLTMWAHDSDLNIGQKLDNAARHFDFVSPMVYPSHYPTGFEGFANPADHPYEVVHDNLVKAQPVFGALRQEDLALRQKNPALSLKIAGVRPWLQDFDLGAVYSPDMVKAQMKASVDGGASGWIFWNARNIYTESAFAPEEGVAR